MAAEIVEHDDVDWAQFRDEELRNCVTEARNIAH